MERIKNSETTTKQLGRIKLVANTEENRTQIHFPDKASTAAYKVGYTITVKLWIKAGLLPNVKFEQNVAGSIWLNC